MTPPSPLRRTCGRRSCRTPRAPALGFLLLLLGLAGAPPSRAETPAPLQDAPRGQPLELDVELCTQLASPAELLSLLRLEVGPRPVVLRHNTSETRPVTRIVLRQETCEPSVITVRILLAGGREHVSELRTEVNLDDVPKDQRSRTLAIAIAELVRTLVPDSAAQPAPSSAGDVPERGRASPEASPPPETPARPPPPWSLAAHFSVGWRAAGASVWTGGGVSVQRRLDLPLCIWVGFDAMNSEARARPGSIDLWVLSPRLGADYLLRLGGTELALGALLDWGIVRGRGYAVDAKPEMPIWEQAVSPRGRAELRVPLGRSWSITTFLELGAYARELTLLARGETAVAFSGLAAGVGAGVSGSL